MVARFSSASRFLQHGRSMIRPERRNLPAGDRSDLPAGEASYLSCALCTCESLEAGEIHIQSESVRCYVRLLERSKLLDASTSNSLVCFSMVQATSNLLSTVRVRFPTSIGNASTSPLT